MTEKLAPGDAILLVDVQNDFCPGGALPVPDGDAVAPVLNGWIARARKTGAVIVASQDWHPAGHVSFKERGGPWPPHCVQGQPGAELYVKLKLPKTAAIVQKGTDRDKDAYSAFDGTGLANKLRAAGVRRLWVGGLALDYCVRATVLDALREGFEAHVLLDGTRAVNVQPGDGDRALEELRQAGALVEGSA